MLKYTIKFKRKLLKMKFKTIKMISLYEWNRFVKETYQRPYNFQQQNDSRQRGLFEFSVPSKYCEDYENDTVPEEVNHEDMGVSFSAWLKRDPTQKLSNPDDQADYCIGMWWERNFYPQIHMIINDLYERKLLEAGEYAIDIDW